MTEQIEIEGKKLVQIRHLGDDFSYSRDYVTRLAREGKVVAAHIGRRWYVDPESLRAYEESAQIEQHIRQKRLSLHRRREREVAESRSMIQSAHTRTTSTAHPRAVLAAVAVLFVGVLGGWILDRTALSPAAVQQLADLTQASRLAVSMGGYSATRNQVASHDAGVDGLVTTQFSHASADYGEQVNAQFVPVQTVEQLAMNEAGVLLLPRHGSASPEQFAMADLFSDPVSLVRASSGLLQVQIRGGLEKEVAPIPLVVVPLERHIE